MSVDLKKLKDEAERSPAAVYLLCGSDGATKEKALKTLLAALCDEAAAEWCLVRVDGKDTCGTAVLDQVSTPPFIGERRVVAVRGAELLEEDEALIPFVEDPPGFSTLILHYERLDKRKKLFQTVKKRGRVVEFDAPRPEELPARVAQLAAEAGIELEPAAVDVVLERARGDLANVEQEVRKLAAYAGDEAVVTGDDAKRLVAAGAPALGQYAVFNFVDALAETRLADALSQLDALLRAGEPPLLVLNMIARQFRLIYAALAWRGESSARLADALGLKSIFPAEKAAAQAAGWSLAEAASALERCSECDAAIKTGVDGRRALEVLAVKLYDQARKRATMGRGSLR